MNGIGLLQLFINNLQCVYVVFGCCKDSLYDHVLEMYRNNAHAASRFSLLRSLHQRDLCGEVTFEVVLSVNGTTTSASEPRRTSADLAIWHLSSPSSDDTKELHTDPHYHSSSWSHFKGKKEAIAGWQASANAAHGTAKWQIDKRDVLVNIDGKRLDPKLGDVDPKVVESMTRRLQEKRFCFPFHLEGICWSEAQGEACDFRHEPRLSPLELLLLKRYARKSICTYGSGCRKANCRFGHNCPYEPGCPKGAHCPFQKFHGMDTAVVGVRRGWSTAEPTAGPYNACR